MKMPSNGLEKKKEKTRAILFAEKSYTIYATVYDYHDQDDKALRFGSSVHISKLSADTFWYFYNTIKSGALRDDYLEAGKDEPEMVTEILFQIFNKESLDEQGSLENSIHKYIKELGKYEFYDPDGTLEKISFSDLMKTIEVKLKELREENISFWERLFEVYKKNKKQYDTQVMRRFERREKSPWA